MSQSKITTIQRFKSEDQEYHLLESATRRNLGEVVINNKYCVSLVNLSMQINFSGNQSE